MPEATQVVGIGSCGIDYFAIVPRLLGPDEKINADRLATHAGGVTATIERMLGKVARWLRAAPVADGANRCGPTLTRFSGAVQRTEQSLH